MIRRRELLAAGWAAPWLMAADRPPPKFPFRMTRNRAWSLVQFEGRGEPLPFMLDTGSSMFAILDDQARALKLPVGDRLKGRSAGRRVDLSYYRSRLVVGGALREDDADIIGLPGLLPAGLKGIIPATRFGAMAFDFDAQEVTITRRFSGLPGYHGLDVDSGAGALSGSMDRFGDHSRNEMFEGLRDQRPVVEAELDGRRLKVMIDTGVPFGLYLTPEHVKREGLWNAEGASGVETMPSLVGTLAYRLKRLSRMKLGNVVFERPIAALGDPAVATPSAGRAYDVVVGMEFLRRLNFVHDPQGRRFWLKPNGAVGDGYRYDRAGMSLEFQDGAWRVVTLRPGGPAQRAGLRLGDQISGWRGRDGIEGLIWALSGAPGTRVEVQVTRDGRPELLGVVLVDLV